MDHQRFQELYRLLTQDRNAPAAQAFVRSAEYAEYGTHLHSCSLCGDWYMAQEVQRYGVDPTQFPCVHLAYYGILRCTTHTDPHDCPDVLVIGDAHKQRFGLPVRDGGSSIVVIRYCPWCGRRLPGTDEA